MPWNTGKPATGAQSLTVKFKLDKEGEATEICATTFDEEMNLLTETIHNFCSKGASSTYVLGKDQEWTLEAVILAGQSAAQIANKRNDIMALQDIEMEVTDELLDAQWKARVAFTGISLPANGDESRKLSLTIKLFEGDVDYTTPIPADTPSKAPKSASK